MSTATTAPQAGPRTGPASVAYSGIPYAPRVPVAEGFLYEGEVTVLAGPGKSGKGLTMAGLAVLVALGLPRPGEAPGTRHEPARVLWVAGGAEDDPIHDLRPRFEAAALQAAADHGLSPGEALAGLARIHDLSSWPDGTPVEVPQDRDALAAEIAALGELDAANRAPGAEGYAGPAWPVRLAVLDPIKGLLGPGHNLNAGARRVMTPLQQLARRTRAAVAVIMHVTKAGSIQGSADVTNAVRLAFTVQAGQGGAPSALVLFASNIASPDDLRFVITGEGRDVRAVFLPPDGAPGAAAEGTLRRRIADHERAAQCDNAAAASPAAASSQAGDYAGRLAGQFAVLRQAMRPDGTTADAARLPGGPWPHRAAARNAAELDAGEALSWRASTQHADVDVAACQHPGGGGTSYAVWRPEGWEPARRAPGAPRVT